MQRQNEEDAAVRRKEAEERSREQRKMQQQRMEMQARMMRQREEEWERNNQCAPAPQVVIGQGGAYDKDEAARIFREARREAAANRNRVEQERAPRVAFTPPPQVYTPPPPPSPGKPKRPLTEQELEEARRQSFWEMRRAAEENKRKLLGLPPLQQAPPPLQQAPQPVPQPIAPPVPQQPIAPVTHQPAPMAPVVHSACPALAQPMVARGPLAVERERAPSVEAPQLMAAGNDVESDDEDKGLRRFLNNDVAAEDSHHGRDEDYRGVTGAIDDILQGKVPPQTDFEDEDEGDLTKFVVNGQTLILPNCQEKDPLSSRVESLRVYLEHNLGTLFLQIYRLMDNIRPDEEEDSMRKVECLLPPEKHMFIPVVAQLLVCEEFLNQANV